MIPHLRLVISPADAAKLEEIWKTHASIVLGMLRTFCSCHEDAQDALQELFLRIGKNPAVVDSAKSPRAFLIVAARRIAIDLARKRAAEQTRIDSPEAIDALHPAQEPIKNDPEVEAAISAAVQKLPPEQRAVFIAKIIQSKTLAVIAAEQNITLNTAASRLRYSLDKIRSQLRPHYEAMKNQTKMKNTLSDSPERLIKPLEPKRVPSVAVDCIFLPPSHDGVDDASGEEFEIAHCDPNSGGNAWEHAGTPTAVELPLDSSENEAEPEIVFEDNTAEEEITDEPAVETENRPVDESAQVVDTTEIPEVAICEFPPSNAENFEEPVVIVCEPFIEPPTIDLPVEEQEPIDLSEQPVDEILTEIFEGETPIDPGSEDLVGEDGSLFSCWNYLSAFDGELQVIDDSSGDSGDESGTDDWSDWDLGEYYNDLLKEYDAFLAENPDWITENSGGEIHAQVVTPSIYTGLELADPGAASAFDHWYYNSYIAPYELETTDAGSDGTGEDITGIDESWEFDLGEFYNQLLSEYDSFLAENPGWITENSGGEIHAQVVTPSIYTGLELADPGAAHAFDLWFEKTHIYCDYSENSDSTWEEGSGVELEMQPFDMEQFNNDLLSEYKSFLEGNSDWVASHTGEFQIQLMTSSEYAQIEFGNPGEAAAFDQWIYDTYIAPYEQYQPDSPEVLPVEGGSLNVGGVTYDYGTLLTTDRSGGVPQEMWRGGFELSGGGTIAWNTGTELLNTGNLSLNQVPTPVLGVTSQTVVTGGTLDISQPVNGTFTVEKGAAITTEEQTFGEGTFQFSADATVASVASQESDSAASPANQASESFEVQAPAMIAPAVTPIVSGSDSVIESPVASANIEQPSVASVELPVLVETASNTHAEEPVAMDDIAFTDDDSFVPAPTESVAPDVADPHASAKEEVTAAVGGAFVVGTATQVAPTRGASIRKELPLKP